MNHPDSFENSSFQLKTLYTEEESRQFFKELKSGVYRVAENIWLLRVEGKGAALIQDPEMIEALKMVRPDDYIFEQKLPASIAQIFPKFDYFEMELERIFQRLHDETSGDIRTLMSHELN